MAFKRSAVRSRLAPPKPKAWHLAGPLTFLGLFWLAGAALAEPGWQAARWGMDAAQLDAAVPGLARLDRPLDFGPLRASRYLREVDLGGRRFTVYFQAGPDGGLAQVLLERRNPRPGDAAAVEAALRRDRGAPARTCGVGVARQEVWPRPDRTTVLSRLDFDDPRLLNQDPNTDRDVLEPMAPRERNPSRQMPRRLLVRYGPPGAPDGCP